MGPVGAHMMRLPEAEQRQVWALSPLSLSGVGAYSQRLQNVHISCEFHSSTISSFSFLNLPPLLGSVVHFPLKGGKGEYGRNGASEL